MLQTSYEILISDWCSDVCSSDLGSSEYFLPIPRGISGGFIAGDLIWSTYRIYAAAFAAAMIGVLWMFLNKTPYGAVITAGAHESEMVRALHRKSVVSGKSVYVRVNFGCSLNTKKKYKNML